MKSHMFELPLNPVKSSDREFYQMSIHIQAYLTIV